MTEKLTLERASIAEAGTRIATREVEGDRYHVRIMGWDEGAEYTLGSSGAYPVEMLKRDVPDAFPEGTRMKANHDGLCEQGGDIRRVIARTISTPVAEADGMYADIRVSKEWSGYVKEYGDIIGLSISAAGELMQTEDENGDMITACHEESGLPIVKRLLSQEDSPYNSIDFVEAPGADGRIVMALEAAQKKFPEWSLRESQEFAAGISERKNSEAVPPRNNQEGIDMDDATLRSILAEHKESILSDLTATITEKLTPAAPAPDEVKLGDLAEAVATAGLSEGGRKAVYEAVERGEGVSDAIKRESDREADIEKRVTERLEREIPAAGVVFAGREGASTLSFESLTEV